MAAIFQIQCNPWQAEAELSKETQGNTDVFPSAFLLSVKSFASSHSPTTWLNLLHVIEVTAWSFNWFLHLSASSGFFLKHISDTEHV